MAKNFYTVNYSCNAGLDTITKYFANDNEALAFAQKYVKEYVGIGKYVIVIHTMVKGLRKNFINQKVYEWHV